MGAQHSGRGFAALFDHVPEYAGEITANCEQLAADFKTVDYQLMLIHLLDGTYELFRHFYGLRRFTKEDRPFGAVVGVLNTILQMVDAGGTHFGVATDHIIESFRNDLWPGYKTGEGIEPALLAQFHPLEEALAAMGVAVWPMVELEADDGLASAAHLAARDEHVQKVCIWTPDKDLAQCVRDDRVVQVDHKAKGIRNADAVRAKFGVDPIQIPDFLALVGDAADGYPGIPGIGSVTAAQLLKRHQAIESFPPNVLGDRQELALLFKRLATLRADAPLFDDVDELRWRGPSARFAELAAGFGDARLVERCLRAASAITAPAAANAVPRTMPANRDQEITPTPAGQAREERIR